MPPQAPVQSLMLLRRTPSVRATLLRLQQHQLYKSPKHTAQFENFIKESAVHPNIKHGNVSRLAFTQGLAGQQAGQKVGRQVGQREGLQEGLQAGQEAGRQEGR